MICGLSGGVDSSVVAVLIHEAIGERLTCIYVDHGLMRLGESEQVVDLFRGHYNIPLVHRDASDLFLGELDGVDVPASKVDIEEMLEENQENEEPGFFERTWEKITDITE